MFKLHNERNRSENPIEDYKPTKCACNSWSHVNHFTFTTMAYLLTLTLSNSFKVYKHQNCNMHAKNKTLSFFSHRMFGYYCDRWNPCLQSNVWLALYPLSMSERQKEKNVCLLLIKSGYHETSRIHDSVMHQFFHMWYCKFNVTRIL